MPTYQFTDLDTLHAPGSEAHDINNEGVAVGDIGEGPTLIGFEISTDGLSPIQVPGADRTDVAAVNDDGATTGTITDAAGERHGFILGPTTSPIEFDVPNADPNTTTPRGINNAGDVVGAFALDGQVFGFERTADGAFSPIEGPLGSFLTVATGINDVGQIVGNALAGSGSIAFVHNPNGTIDTIAVPLADQTSASGINNAGQVVGTYRLAGLLHGFVETHGAFVSLDDPNALSTGLSGTVGSGINDAGDVVGTYSAADGSDHSFLASASNTGPLLIDFPTNGLPLQAQTTPISASRAFTDTDPLTSIVPFGTSNS